MLDNEALNEDEYVTTWYMVPWIPRNPHGKDYLIHRLFFTVSFRH